MGSDRLMLKDLQWKKSIAFLKMGYCRVLLFSLLAILFLVVTGCAMNRGSDIKIGVAMPTREFQRWNQDGDNLERLLRQDGYLVDLEYADNNPQLQISQIRQMIAEGCKVIVIASVDTGALGEVLYEAKAKGCKIISYDRLIMNTDIVDYYATFDNLGVGIMMAEYLEEKLGLNEGKGPYRIEFFAGGPDDSNAIFLWEGSMEVLRPYMENGQLVTQSGENDLKNCAIDHWSVEKSHERMKKILQDHYSDGTRLDAVLCASDSVAFGVLQALREAGYSPEAGNMPLITGQDAEKRIVKAIMSGEQSMSIFKDTRLLAAQVASMVNAIVAGREPETNDIGNYDNGVKILPTFLVRPELIDLENYREVLFGSGYYSDSDFEE